jgi:F-type H+/Na+-transporting ATPase subunit alpha
MQDRPEKGALMNDEQMLVDLMDTAFAELEQTAQTYRPKLRIEEIGYVTQVSKGVAFVEGLPGVQSEELLRFPGNRLGMALNLDAHQVGVVLMDSATDLGAGDTVRRTHRVMDVPVGDALLGRVMDPTGRPLDHGGPIRTAQRFPIERPAPAIMDRDPVVTPLQTGIKAVDAVVPIGRGQRELILGDRQTGKTAIAVDTIMNQKNYGVVCVYCAIGQRSSAVAKVVADLEQHGALGYTTVVVTSGADPAGLQYAAPYAATSIAEHYMSEGRDALIVYDDLTRHARAYRELSLLLRRPPGREAYPGDIFYIHSRLLERATHLRGELGGGSVTALPIIETQAQNISAYIPTNLISITDGQIYLSPHLFQQGVLPAIDVGKSVSRVGGKAQLPAYRRVAGNLKLTYSQFEELERFSRYGTRLEAEKQRTLDRGRRVRETLKQQNHSPLPPGDQVVILLAVTRGVLDEVPIKKVGEAEQAVREHVRAQKRELVEGIEAGKELSDQESDAILEAAKSAVAPFLQG